MMSYDRKRLKRSTLREDLRPTLPSGLEEFWVDVGWRMSREDKIRDPTWSNSSKKLIAPLKEEKVQWWSAFVKVISFDMNKYELYYSRSPTSTSEHDLDREDPHTVMFLLGGWLRHLKGTEKGKSCLWRNAKWETSTTGTEIGREQDSADDEASQDLARNGVADELRGCFLDLQQVVYFEKGMREDILVRLDAIERRMTHIEMPSQTDEIKSFICNAIVTGLSFRGRECRSKISSSASSECYYTTMAKVRSVDCTLPSFRSLAREANVMLEEQVVFLPSKFDVLTFNKRQKQTLKMVFDSFHSMCGFLRLREEIRSDLIFQSKHYADGNVAGHQIVGTVIEKSERRHGNIPSDHVRECFVLPAADSSILQRKTSHLRFAIHRKEGKRYSQSSICEEQFVCHQYDAKQILTLCSVDLEDERTRRSFELEWEPLKMDARNLMVSGGNHATPGKLNIIIPIVMVRSTRAIQEIEEIIKREFNSLVREC